MRTKLLSIIIPTYNMEALLPICLDSLVSAEHADALDILIVNDGSKDNSSLIGHRYESQYPGIVTVVDKPNGNYGSTINAGLPLARGKYVKILDSDDWFDTVALDCLLEKIEALDVDIVHTPFTQRWPKGVCEIVRYNTMGKEPYEYGRIYELDHVLKDGYIRFFLMHALAYRTELLLTTGYRQTEGISYTDQEWACYPIYYAKTICFLDINLYQYNLDRDGQTMAPEVIMRSLPQLDKLNDSMLLYYRKNKSILSEVRAVWMKQFYENRLRVFYKLYLLDMPRADFDANRLKAVDEKYLPIMEEFDLHPRLYPENKIIRCEYIRYWHRYGKRWPIWFEKLNHIVDGIVKWGYVKLIRR